MPNHLAQTAFKAVSVNVFARTAADRTDSNDAVFRNTVKIVRMTRVQKPKEPSMFVPVLSTPSKYPCNRFAL